MSLLCSSAAWKHKLQIYLLLPFIQRPGTAASELGTVMLQCRTDRPALSTTERRSMSPLYIRPESLSLLDLSMFLLLAPTTPPPPLRFPNRILVPSSSPITLVRGVPEVFSATATIIIISLPAGLRAPTPHLTSRTVTLLWKPAPFFWLLDAFLGTRRKMPEPTKKGRSVVSEGEISMLLQKMTFF